MAQIECTKCKRVRDTKHFRVLSSDDPRWVWGAFQFEAECNDCLDPPNADIYSMGTYALIEEIKKLRAGIRKHRDATGHNLCWYVPELWALLPERLDPRPEVPPVGEFLENCAAYRASLDHAIVQPIVWVPGKGLVFKDTGRFLATSPHLACGMLKPMFDFDSKFSYAAGKYSGAVREMASSPLGLRERLKLARDQLMATDESDLPDLEGTDCLRPDCAEVRRRLRTLDTDSEAYLQVTAQLLVGLECHVSMVDAHHNHIGP
jgi:hypothetical protein